METLDLHGVSHQDAPRLVENFVLLQPTPVRVITGNSLPMRAIVLEILKEHDFSWDYESHWNIGSIIVF
jgi:hypothetical protein